jgi:hypothetical protein
MPLVPARIVKLKRADFKREWVPPTWTDRPQRRRRSARFSARASNGACRRLRLDVYIVAYDTTDDARENYDAYFVEAGEREMAPDARGWFAISRDGRRTDCTARGRRSCARRRRST